MHTQSLGELEKEVMDILWTDKKCSARDVLNKLQRDKKLAYTTVATILQRLHDKELVKRVENKSGYLYSPQLSKETYSKSIANAFLNKFINSFGDTAIASFADSIEKLPLKKKNYLLKLLNGHDTHK